jgi:hypothetical protein
VENEAVTCGNCELVAAAQVLRQLNTVLIIHNEMRAKDAYAELEQYFNGANSRAVERTKKTYLDHKDSLDKIVSEEPVSGTNAKLLQLSALLKDLHERYQDPRGM